VEGGRDFLELTLGEWLEELGERGPVPGGGSAAAMTAAMAASLVAMTARLSAGSWPEANGVVVQAARLRNRLAAFAQTDAEVYAASLDAMAHATDVPDERRDFELGSALDRAAETPLRIAETAHDVVLLAAEAAVRGDPQQHPDAQAAAALAAAAAQAAARLVEVNLTTTDEDPRVRQARAITAAADEALKRAFASDR
jgi:formiminotetrahydrofolate cyclodeaminase